MNKAGACRVEPVQELSRKGWEVLARGKQKAFELTELNILLIDDNPADVRIVTEGLKDVLRAAKLSVAKDGVEALEFLRQKGPYVNAPRPDLILLDLRLPKMSGFEVLQEIKQDPVLASIPVVVQTSSDAEADIEKAYGLHANSYITKPNTFDEFSRMIQVLVDFWVTVAKLPQGEDWRIIYD